MRIFLVRHGQSEGNVNHAVYDNTPDHNITLTEKGVAQALDAGIRLRKEFNVRAPKIYTSTHERAVQTAEKLSESANFMHSKLRFDPRIVEQEWRGNLNNEFDTSHHHKRNDFGLFHYRFDGGESGLDVYCRAKSFLNDVFLDCGQSDDIIITSHGITINIMIMILLNERPEFAESIKYPKNCEVIHLEGSKYNMNLKSELTYRK